MTKFPWLIVSLFLAQGAMAGGLRFTLDCKADKSIAKVPAHILKYKAVKLAFPAAHPAPGKKWNSKYVLEVYFKSQPSKAYEYPLVPAGSGDEDYNEYNVKGTGHQKKTINVQAAYIQNQFKWVSLIDTDGYGFADCR